MCLLDHDPCPLIAVLRGLTVSEVPAVAEILWETGFHFLEVPLNRLGALDAIGALVQAAPPEVRIGGGTVLTVDDVEAINQVGGQFVVAPNCEPAVIGRALEHDMMVLPGVCTPTEAFRALAAGAHGLKLFPAEMIPPTTVKALRSVLPEKTCLLLVGGIRPNDMTPYVDAGATGFGIGSLLYRPGVELAALKRAAQAFMDARQALISPA